MASFVHTAPAAGRLSRAIANAFAAFAEWREARATHAALDKLSNRELEDIGLSRADLDDMAGLHRHG